MLPVQKRELIQAWKPVIVFTGTLFEKTLRLNGAEVLLKFFGQTGVEIKDETVLDQLLTRLKVKIIVRPLGQIYLHQDWLTLFNGRYSVRFYTQNTYAEFDQCLRADIILKLLLYEKRGLLAEKELMDNENHTHNKKHVD
jgi:hypothetical protein